MQWTPPDSTDETGHDVEYFGRVLQVAAQLLGQPALTFVLTWDLGSLPVTGRHVVAVLQGDEDGRIPRWANDVLVTFKCYGARPPWMPLRRDAGMVGALELAHFLRRALLWIPGACSVALGALRMRRRPAIFPVPLGYYNQEARPILPASARRWLISFAGSGLAPEHQRGLRGKLGTPKERSRMKMLRALDEVSRSLPAGSVATIVQASFPSLLPGQDTSARQMTRAYSDLLAESRLCVVPRGNSPETFRFFEALRAGCVVICEALPRHWFYRGAPVITLDRWNDLPRAVLDLAADPHELERRQQASLRWWDERCSEDAVGRYVADRIRACAP